MKIKTGLAVVGAMLTSCPLWADDWGTAWNDPSVIGLDNLTIESNQSWNGQASPGTRGAATELFDNVSDSNNCYLHDVKAGGDPGWVKFTVNDGCCDGKDIILKRYQFTTTQGKPKTEYRFPSGWSIYGCPSADLTPADKDKMTLLHSVTVNGLTSPETMATSPFDLSNNTQSFRTYFVEFRHTKDNLLFLDEMYLYGEIKDHDAGTIVYQLPLETKFVVDGKPRAVTVTPIEPADALVEYALSADGPWSDEPIAVTDAGIYEIFYRLSAEGRTPASGSLTMTLSDDIVAAVRLAEGADGKAYATARATTNEQGRGEFFGTPGNLFAERTDVRSLLRADPVVYYSISGEFCPGNRIVVTGLCFRVNSAMDLFTTARLPHAFRLSGRNADDEPWQILGESASISWDEEMHFDAETGIWTQELPLTNRRNSYRQYRFDNWSDSDTQLEQIGLRGMILPPGFLILVR